jgi:alkanesulfonate monooxygenase SsuD/methylene tetrahydromethanopterin reductase-like flavin-dependent oxidoreductase (luciferase family)
MLSERFGMATAVNAVIKAAHDTQTPELPAVAEDLAREVTLFGTYDQAQDAIGAWLGAGADSVNLVLPPNRPEEELTDVLNAVASPVATTAR